MCRLEGEFICYYKYTSRPEANSARGEKLPLMRDELNQISDGFYIEKDVACDKILVTFDQDLTHSDLQRKWPKQKEAFWNSVPLNLFWFHGTSTLITSCFQFCFFRFWFWVFLFFCFFLQLLVFSVKQKKKKKVQQDISSCVRALMGLGIIV